MQITLILVAAMGTVALSQTCYSADGQALDEKYKPCYPDASSSACCQLNGTQGENQQNDLCLDSGLCQSTSGWYAGFLYINGCTDPTGQADGCPKQCNSLGLGTQYSWSVLQCQPGVFCCRAASDTTNCCNDNSTIIKTSHIGSLLLPGTTRLLNTTFGVAGDNDNSATSSNSTASTVNSASSSDCPADNSATVGGAVGGVLGAALIGALVALFFALKGRKRYKSELDSTSATLTSTEGQAAEEKAALQKQIDNLHLQQSARPPTYISPVSTTNDFEVANTDRPQKSHNMVNASELDQQGSERSELEHATGNRFELNA